jgi:hypothetical protein
MPLLLSLLACGFQLLLLPLLPLLPLLLLVVVSHLYPPASLYPPP